MKSYTKGQQPLYLSDKTLAERYEVHRASIWRWVQAGKFPNPIKVVGSTRWKLADVEQWEAAQQGAK